MTGMLNRTLIRSNIYPKTHIMYENDVKEVIRVNEKTVVLEIDSNEKRIDKTLVQDKVIKYTVQIGNKIFDLSFSDYKLANGYANGTIVEGYTILVKTKARIGDTVRIDCLQTVDKHNLMDFNSRFGTVKDKNKNFYTISMTRNIKLELKLHRTRFATVNEKDSKIFFKLLCPTCGV